MAPEWHPAVQGTLLEVSHIVRSLQNITRDYQGVDWAPNSRPVLLAPASTACTTPCTAAAAAAVAAADNDNAAVILGRPLRWAGGSKVRNVDVDVTWVVFPHNSSIVAGARGNHTSLADPTRLHNANIQQPKSGWPCCRARSSHTAHRAPHPAACALLL